MSQPHQAREIGLGVVSILIGAALLIGSRGFGAIPGQNYGADTLPKLIAGLSIAVGIAMLIQTLRRRTAPPAETDEIITEAATIDGATTDEATQWIHDPRAWGRLGIGLAIVGFYALFSPMTGFIIAAFVVVAGLALLMGVRPLSALILAIVAAFALRYAFADILLVPLPRLSLTGMGG